MDILDTRDLEDQLVELKDELTEWVDDNRKPLDFGKIEELNALIELKDELDCAGWEYGIQMINKTYFQEYAEEFAYDIDAVHEESTWPNNHIDWEAAANELAIDYSSVDYNGETYYYREA